MNWRLQNPKGFGENIYTFNELASPKSKGFQGKYIHKYDLDQNIIVRAWCNHFEPMNPLLVIWTIGGAHTTSCIVQPHL